MRRCVEVLMGVAALALAAPAAAQSSGPVPDKGMVAVGLSVGVAVPGDDFLTNGVNLGVGIEGYLTARVSIRGQLSGAWWDIFGHSFDGNVRPLAINGNLVYNWERGKWHPYATGGLGIYRYRFDESNLSSSDTKLGVDLGGGIEYFFTREDAVTGELLVHAVPGLARSALSDYKSRYWTLSAGYKKYW